MTPADYAAIASGAVAVITAITALVKVLQHNRDTAAHINKDSGGPQSLRLRDGGMS